MNNIAEIHKKRVQALIPGVPGDIPEKLAREIRPYQGIPGIEVGKEGSLYATWYAGGKGEGPDNYVILSFSRDHGRSWEEVQCINPEGQVRAYDPTLWFDPQGRLWWFWAQAYSPELGQIFDGKCGVFCCCCENPEKELKWSAPRRIADGIMMNKPIADSKGNWLLPTAIWACEPKYLTEEDKRFAFSNVTISRDNGNTFEYLGSADVPERTFDEHHIVERNDGTLWMLVRCQYGIGESFSSDGGKTWSPGKPAVFGGPNSRFAIRRLKSGKLLLINHRIPFDLPGETLTPGMRLRTNLTAWLSDDDGKTWKGGMLISGRQDVSYPDVTQDADGRIFMIYDHARYTFGNILLASFTEDDILAGRLVTPGSYLDLLVSSLLPKQ